MKKALTVARLEIEVAQERCSWTSLAAKVARPGKEVAQACAKPCAKHGSKGKGNTELAQGCAPRGKGCARLRGIFLDLTFLDIIVSIRYCTCFFLSLGVGIVYFDQSIGFLLRYSIFCQLEMPRISRLDFKKQTVKNKL